MTIKLHLGNCIDVLSTMADKSIDITITSPPYDNLRTYNGNGALWCEDVWRDCIAELYRVTADGGVVVWITDDATTQGSETGTSFRQVLWAMDCGFNLHDTMIWQKNTSQYHCERHRRYVNVFEYMFVWSKGRPKTVFLLKDRPNKCYGTTKNVRSHRQPDGTLASVAKQHTTSKFGLRFNVWDIGIGGGKSYQEEYVREHPAVFPEQLVRDHLLTWSQQGDTVLDPFMGSSTTGKVAKQYGRSFIGIELDTRYYQIAERRINEA